MCYQLVVHKYALGAFDVRREMIAAEKPQSAEHLFGTG
jgi:hypothetical protein